MEALLSQPLLLNSINQYRIHRWVPCHNLKSRNGEKSTIISMKIRRRVIPVLLVTILVLLYLHQRGSGPQGFVLPTGPYPPGCAEDTAHEIDDRIVEASYKIWEFDHKVTTLLSSAAAAYRERRGRHPPPGFDLWHEYAMSNNAVIVEDFFDQIYDDIEPFFGQYPLFLRNSIASWTETIQVRGGKVTSVPNQFVRTKVWVEMISKIAHYLPDLDIPINRLDEPRVIVSATDIDLYYKTAKNILLTKIDHNPLKFSNDIKNMTWKPGKPETITWSTDLAQLQQALHDSCINRSDPMLQPLTLQTLPWSNAKPHSPTSSVEHHIVNITAAKDICSNALMIKQHGSLVEPATIDFTTNLIPVFTGSKLPMYNDIIIPEPAYYSDEPMFTGKTWLGDYSTWYNWRQKIHGLVWRGGSTGGAAHNDNWQWLHRHRLVSALNASESDNKVLDHLPRGRPIAEWLPNLVNVGFTRLYCDDAKDASSCPDLGSHYKLLQPLKMARQYQWKYLPDTDGNSISERFRAFLLSNSAPIKATLFNDWHDHRLVAWYHYIPMKISYTDLYSIMQYFLGYDKTCAHDAAGQAIAEQGRDWASKVLRKEDMVIYLHRALLEYARVVNDERDRLGYGADLL